MRKNFSAASILLGVPETQSIFATTVVVRYVMGVIVASGGGNLTSMGGRSLTIVQTVTIYRCRQGGYADSSIYQMMYI